MQSPRFRILVYAVILLTTGLGLGSGLRWLLQGPPPPGGSGPTAPAAKVVFSVVTEPSNATVMVDGAIAGQSPVRGLSLAAGPHSLRIEKAGFQPLTQAVRLSGVSQASQMKLAPVEYAALEVRSTPAGAEVYVDGSFRGVTPAKVEGLDPGVHDLTVEKVNFTSDQGRYVLHAGEVKSVNDIVLQDKQKLMLKALLDISPRSINNNLDMAHYYYINNDMAQSVRFYMRARELAALPMPAPPADTPQDELNFLPQLFQDEIRRVKIEEDHHYVAYHEYYGTALDFDNFKRLYALGVEESKRWNDGIHQLSWVTAEAAKTPDDPPGRKAERAGELFGDFLAQRADCGPAVAGLVAADLNAGKVAEASELFTRAKTLLIDGKLPDDEKPFVAPAWLQLGIAWRQVSRSAAGAVQKQALANAAECAQKAVETAGADSFTQVAGGYQIALSARDRGDKAQYGQLLKAGYEQVKLLADNSKANADSLARCRKLQAPMQYALAFAVLDEGDKGLSVTLLRDLRSSEPEDSAYSKAANRALELLDSGHVPVAELSLP